MPRAHVCLNKRRKKDVSSLSMVPMMNHNRGPQRHTKKQAKALSRGSSLQSTITRKKQTELRTTKTVPIIPIAPGRSHWKSQRDHMEARTTQGWPQVGPHLSTTPSWTELPLDGAIDCHSGVIDHPWIAIWWRSPSPLVTEGLDNSSMPTAIRQQ